MSEPIEDADFEDMGRPVQKSYSTEVIRSETEHSSSQALVRNMASNLGPVDQGFFESRERALARKRREIDQQDAIIQAQKRLFLSGIELTDAIVAAQNAEETAQIRAQARLKAERAAARKQILLDEIEELELQQERDRVRRQPQLDKEREADRRTGRTTQNEVGSIRAQLEKERAEFELEQLRAKRAAFNSPPAPAPPTREPKNQPTPELRALVDRAESIAAIERYCVAQRAVADANLEIGVLDEEAYEDKVDEIKGWEIWAKTEFEDRQERRQR